MRVTLSVLGTELVTLQVGERPPAPPAEPDRDVTSHQGGSFNPVPQHNTLERGYIRLRP